MPDRYAAFISYAHRYKGWVGVLQGNLERCLEHCGARPHEVFLDTVDLGSGRSWVGQLQAGLDRAEHFILVVTPEALASPRVSDEWQGFVATREDWVQGHCHLVRLVDTPLPPFLSQVQWVDFQGHDETKYEESLKELVGGLLGHTTKRKLPDLQPDLEVPAPPVGLLPPKLRSQLVEWLEPRLGTRITRKAIAAGLTVEPAYLEAHPSWACAASALLVRTTGADDPAAGALRVVEGLVELFEDNPEDVAPLVSLREELEALRRQVEGSGFLVTYLKRVEKDHDRLVPYFQQRAEMDLLDRVYVKLELRPETRSALLVGEGRKGEGGRPGGSPDRVLDRPLGIRGVLALAPEEHPWVTRRWVVLGDPGAGKTTLVRHLAAALARDPGPEQERPWVPVLESLPRLMRQREWLLDRLARRMRQAGEEAEVLPSVLEREARQGRLLLLLDGLDEVPKEDQEDAEGLLRDLSTRWPATPVVVTSRPIGYRRPGSEFRELELQPLDAERRREFLARWFGRHSETLEEERAGEALAVLREDPGLWELAGNPLYLTLMALLLEQGGSPDRHRTRLYDQVFELLMEGKHRTDGEPMEAQEAVRRVLDHLGYALTRDNRDAEAVTALEARLYQPEADAVREPLERVPRWRRSLRPFLDDLAERTGILGPHDGPDADWRFWHRTFREALAAEELEARWEAEGEEAILAGAREIGEEEEESRWAEPYALLAGRVENPDALVRALVEENRALGLRALATAQGLEEETVSEVLELSDKWEERAEVYIRIPELLDHAERSLLLLDRLRCGTTNGNDLYFLEMAAREVMRRWPDHRLGVEVLRSRLFDHIPVPDSDLFQWVQTPRDGRVTLWRNVPPGTFWMGSSEGEEPDSERPRQQVKFLEGFQMGAVPVTNSQYAAFDPGHKLYRWEGLSEEELAQPPVVGVTWYQAVSFCRWLASLGEPFRGARLPTEAEWEYACRAGTETRYWSGDEEAELARVGWYKANSGERTHCVGEKSANPWGLYDVHGNVWEWTMTPWDSEAYSKRPLRFEVDPSQVEWEADTPIEPGGADRAVRGGGCLYGADGARAAYRSSGAPGIGTWDRGFRVVLPGAPSR